MEGVQEEEVSKTGKALVPIQSVEEMAVVVVGNGICIVKSDGGGRPPNSSAR